MAENITDALVTACAASGASPAARRRMLDTPLLDRVAESAAAAVAALDRPPRLRR